MTGVIIIKGIIEVPEGFSGNALLLALLSSAAYGGRWRTWACGISFVAIMGYMTYRVVIVDLSDFEGNQILFRIFAMFWNYVIFGAAWWFGDILRSRRHRTVELEERTVQLEHEREENARRAVLDERVRIARELHDVAAHHVSVMGVQAGAARHILDQKQGKVHEALSIIETSSRQAVAELHRLLGFLRQGSQTGELSPQPSMKHLNTLITEMEEAGLPIKVKIEGEERPLPPSVDLSAYRIIQEALTNTLKHAGPAKATITVRYSDDDIALEILDDGCKSTASSEKKTSGKGLIGMRERVNLHGGELETRKIPQGGFLVRAKLPLKGGIS
jgi:signal transduction histidine kinase